MILGPPSAAQVNDTLLLNWCNNEPSLDGLGTIVVLVMFGCRTIRMHQKQLKIYVTVQQNVDKVFLTTLVVIEWGQIDTQKNNYI